MQIKTCQKEKISNGEFIDPAKPPRHGFARLLPPQHLSAAVVSARPERDITHS